MLYHSELSVSIMSADASCANVAPKIRQRQRQLLRRQGRHTCRPWGVTCAFLLELFFNVFVGKRTLWVIGFIFSFFLSFLFLKFLTLLECDFVDASCVPLATRKTATPRTAEAAPKATSMPASVPRCFRWTKSWSR